MRPRPRAAASGVALFAGVRAITVEAVLIGRESECARLDDLLDRAQLGRSGALVISGEPGIGKTALLEYAASRAESWWSSNDPRPSGSHGTG